MATIFEQFQQCKFRGIPCLPVSSTVTSGRKIIVQEYPNTDRRDTQDLGRLQDTFALTVRIHGTGFDYIMKRDNFRAALNQKGRGLLNHHELGDHMVVVTTYSLNERITRGGVADFNVTFVKADLSIFPEESSDNLPKINQGRQNVLKSMSNNIANEWINPNGKAVNFSDAQLKLLDAANTFVRSVEAIQTGGIQGLVRGTTGLASLPGIEDFPLTASFNTIVEEFGISVLNELSETSNFQSVIKSFVKDINPNILKAFDLGNDFVGLFDAATKTVSTPEAGLNLYKPMFSFGENDVSILPTTQPRIERTINRDVLNKNIQIGALSESYQIASQIQYKNDIQLQEVKDSLEVQYQKINKDTSQITIEPRIQLSDLRNEMRKFFDQEAVSTPKITTVETNLIPATVLTHEFYGNLDQLQAVIDLNDFDNLSFIKGDVDILTNIENVI
jgi:prophage DNA circulation protein